jgi:uncharacterized protein (DUF302 family)
MYAYSKTVEMPFAQAVEAARQALKDQGFGVLCEIDARQTLQEKTGEDIGPYVILGGCNPPLALRALTAEPAIGVLLPCNVVVYERDGAVTVAAVDVKTMLGVVGNRELDPIANEVDARLRGAVDRLA